MDTLKSENNKNIPANELAGYCGLVCATCPIYLATLEPDPAKQEQMRTSIAILCTEKYGMKLNAEDITDCDGCRANTGRVFPGCLKCNIRKCAIDKQIESCAYCEEYVCEDLMNLFELDPEAKNRLDEIRTHRV